MNICQKRMDRSLQSVLHTIVSALLALLLSGLLLLAVFAAYTLSNIPEGANREHEKVIAGSSLRAIAGKGKARGEQLVITGWEPQGADQRAIAVSSVRFQAANYPLVSTQIDGEYPGPMLRLVWRTATGARGMNAVVLNRTDIGASRVNMANHPQWRGTVIEIGIYSVTRDTEQELAITHVTLEPHSWRGALSSYISSWTAFRGWTVRSVNFLYGTADVFAQSVVVLVAIWCGLAVALLLGVPRILPGARIGAVGANEGAAIAAIIVLAWISLDLLWQKELMAQLDATKATFAGKTQHEKHLADIDGYLYSYIQRISEEVLPEHPARIFLIHNSSKHNFRRLKSQYYLLPHNVYNFGKRPPKKGLRKGDYILSLGESVKVEFDAGKNTLIGGKDRPVLYVEKLDEDPMGVLYQLTADPQRQSAKSSDKTSDKRRKKSKAKRSKKQKEPSLGNQRSRAGDRRNE